MQQSIEILPMLFVFLGLVVHLYWRGMGFLYVSRVRDGGKMHQFRG